MREAISCVLAAVLFTTTALEARAGALQAVPGGGAASEQRTGMIQRLLKVKHGTMIEVSLRNKQTIRGRLGDMDDGGFNLTTLQGQKIVKERVDFAEVKSFRKLEGGKAGRRVLWMLAGVGALVLILSVIILARGDD